jgi:hypothetical protein
VQHSSTDHPSFIILKDKHEIALHLDQSIIMSKASAARSKFAELRALRESGRKRIDTYEVQREADLYEEVDEERYKKVVRERLNRDDFVVDDNGEGYADDGREEWDQRHGYCTESEEEHPLKGRGKSGMPDAYPFFLTAY